MKDFRKQKRSFFILPERIKNGTYTLIIRAYDKAGNRAQEQITLVVR